MANVASLEHRLRQKFGAVRRSQGRNGVELIVPCPVCGKKKLSVNANTGLFQCWHGCMSGHVDDLGLKAAVARKELAPRGIEALPADIELPGTLVPLSALPEDHPCILYMERRKFNPVLLEQLYGIRYCSEGRKFAGGIFDTTNTLVIPIWYQHRLIGWQARLLYDVDKVPEEQYEAMGFFRDPDGDWVKPPKYFTSPGFDKGRIVYNYDWARQSQVIVICEGVFDAWSVGRCAVATFGKTLTQNQVDLIRAYWSAAVVLLDPDAEAESIKLAHQLSTTVVTIRVQLEGYKDAGEAPQDEVWAQIGRAAHQRGVDLLKYKIII